MLIIISNSDCFPADSCKTESQNCSKFATCQNVELGRFLCSCKVGYAGNGFYCGNDSDADGIPDYALGCNATKSCRKDNCIFIPNSGQEDADNDGIGIKSSFNSLYKFLLEIMHQK